MYEETCIIGNVGQRPELRFTQSGDEVTSFSVAVNRRWRNADGEKQELTKWFRVNCWKELAVNCSKYVFVGMTVMVKGEISASTYTDKNGQAKASLELRAAKVVFLSSSDERPAEDATADSDSTVEEFLEKTGKAK